MFRSARLCRIPRISNSPSGICGKREYTQRNASYRRVALFKIESNFPDYNSDWKADVELFIVKYINSAIISTRPALGEARVPLVQESERSGVTAQRERGDSVAS